MGVCVCVCEVVKWDISTVHHIILLVFCSIAQRFYVQYRVQPFNFSIPQFLDSSNI
jgi:hypothetical protein